MPIKQLRRFLDEHDVKYVIVEHSPAYTSQEIAAEAHVPGAYFAKTVVVRVDGHLALALLPATDRLDTERLAASTGARSVELASESDFAERFPECELGAMPPFGSLFGMDVYMSPSLAEADELAFNAGTHTEIMRLAHRDFLRLVEPAIVPM